MLAADAVSDPLRCWPGVVDRRASSLFVSFMATSPLLSRNVRSDPGARLPAAFEVVGILGRPIRRPTRHPATFSVRTCLSRWIELMARFGARLVDDMVLRP